MDTQRLVLRLLRILYKVLRLMTGELKVEITTIERELNESTDSAERTPNRS